MKKTKNLLLLAIMFVSIFAFAGLVKADDPWNFDEAWLICNPDALDPGDTASCYYFGKVGGNTGTRNAGFYTLMYTTDNLEIIGVAPNTNLDNAHGEFVKMTSSQAQSIGTLDPKMPSGLEKFKCNVTTSKDTKTRGCGIYYTKTGSDGAYVVGDMKVYGNLRESDITDGGYSLNGSAVLGEVIVKLDDNNDVHKCGDLCIASFAVLSEDDWGHADCRANGGTSNWSGETCSEDTMNLSKITPSHHRADGIYDCFEIEMKQREEQNRETGAFVSYAILAAGALIAISAVTIAKKHNRLQKI